MRERLSLLTDTIPHDVTETLINLRITHRRASIPELESSAFRAPEKALKGIKAIEGVLECLLLQTCNRTEIYALVSGEKINRARAEIVRYWRSNTSLSQADFNRLLEESSGTDLLVHLFRLTSGLESMMVGEDQILGQVQAAFSKAKKLGTLGPIVSKVLEGAIGAGKAIRSKTMINKGAISIGSVAVNLIDEHVDTIANKKVAIIGAGEIGGIVGKSLVKRKVATVFVTNRTYERAVWLAKMLNVEAVRFDKLKDLIASVDVVVVATSAPHYVITRSLVAEAMQKRNNGRLVIIDLSHPRNVDPAVGGVPNVELRNIDNLRGIAYANLKTRLKEAQIAQELIEEEIARLKLRLKTMQVEPVISAIFSKVEGIRRREVDKALKMMNNVINCKEHQQHRCGRCMKIVDDFSYELVERLLSDPISNLRLAALNGDNDKIKLAREIFGTKSGS